MPPTVPTLCVSVRLHGRVVEERSLSVGAAGIALGEAPEAVVAFPGATVRVRRLGDRLQVQGGLWLDPGRPLRYRREAVEVELEAVLARPLPRRVEWAPDLRLLVATAAVVLFVAFWESVTAFADTHAVALSRVGRQWIGDRPTLAGWGAEAPVEDTATPAPAPAVPPVVRYRDGAGE